MFALLLTGACGLSSGSGSAPTPIPREQAPERFIGAVCDNVLREERSDLAGDLSPKPLRVSNKRATISRVPHAAEPRLGAPAPGGGGRGRRPYRNVGSGGTP